MEELVPLPLIACRFPFPKIKSFLESKGCTDLLPFKGLFSLMSVTTQLQIPALSLDNLYNVSEPGFPHLAKGANEGFLQTHFPWVPSVQQACAGRWGQSHE